MTPRQGALLTRLEAWFDGHPHASASDAARDMNMPQEAANSVVGLGVSAGRLVLIGSEVCTRHAFDALVADLRSKFGENSFEPREMREALGASRVWVDRFADVLGRNGLLERFPGGWRLKQGE